MASRWISARELTTLLGPTPFHSPVYRDLSDRIRLLIVDGRLSHDIRLPSERDLADLLQISRTTVAGSYAELRERQFLRARRGAGNFVSIPQTLGTSTHLPNPFATDGDTIGLTAACTAAPAGLGAIYARAVERMPSLLASPGYLPDGLLDLRVALADRFTRQGLATDPNQIIVTGGALSALNIVTRTLLGSGDRVLAESPTYYNALDALRSTGARTIGLPVTPAGWESEAWSTAVRQTKPQAAYLIPDFQNPTGALMPEETRRRLGSLLRRNRTIPIIDETIIDIPLDGQPMPPHFASFSTDAITLGSASKSFWGGLRIGWIRAPHKLVRPMIETRAAVDLGAAVIDQVVVAELLADPEMILAAHRESLRARRDHLLAELARLIPAWESNVPTGGMTLWVTMPTESSTRLAALAPDHGVIVAAGPRFYIDGGGERKLRIPYTASEEVLTEAVQRLAAAWAEVQRRGGRKSPKAPLDLIA